MNTDTKIILSEQELQLACNTDWILTKHKINKAVYQLFGGISEFIQKELINDRAWLPEEVITGLPKINKGENYLQFPYVLLDHPRFFDREDIFALRTMFWWGNFFSCTMLLAGKYKTSYENALRKNLLKRDTHLYICTNMDKWDHHFGNDNYCELKNMSQPEIEKIIAEKEFIKIAAHLPLQKWHEIPELIQEEIKLLLGLLKS